MLLAKIDYFLLQPATLVFCHRDDLALLVAGLARHYRAIIAAKLNLTPVVISVPLPAPRTSKVDSGVALAILVLGLCHVALHVGDHSLLGADQVVDAGIVGCDRQQQNKYILLHRFTQKKRTRPYARIHTEARAHARMRTNKHMITQTFFHRHTHRHTKQAHTHARTHARYTELQTNTGMFSTELPRPPII